ncbi:MAG: phage replication initiation protein, NGO0469 family [Sulfuricaulis sp.]
MALTVKKPADSEYQLTPQGTHLGVCYLVVDMGLQDTPFGAKHKIRLGWELPNELMADGRPFVCSKEYTASLHPDSNLAQDLVAWRGKSFTDEELAGFDVFKVLGAPCMLTVIHATSKAGKTYANVKSVTSLPKGTAEPVAVNDTLSFSLESPDETAFQKLPEWMQKKINRNSPSSAPAEMTTPVYDNGGDYGDDIPF